MEKIFSMLAVAAVGALALASCDNSDTTNEIATHGLQVNAAATSFGARGGTQRIDVAATPTTAYANDSWATVAVSGNAVDVTVSQNNDRQTRHTTVVVKSSPQDSAIVDVDQDGMVFALDVTNIKLGDDAVRQAYAVKHNLDVQVTTTTSWLQPTLTGDSLAITATANTTGEPREGWIHYVSGSVTDSIHVLQFEPERDVLGDYALTYHMDGSTRVFSTPVSLYKTADGTYAMRFTDPFYEDYDWAVPVTLGEDTPTFTFSNLARVGTFERGSNNYTTLWMILMTDGKDVHTYSYSSLRATATYTVGDDGTGHWPFTISMNVGYVFYGFQLGLSTDGTSVDSGLNPLLRFPNAEFVRQHASGAGSKPSGPAF